MNTRGYLPHVAHTSSETLIQSITFRLFDSVPETLIAKWKEELEQTSGTDANQRYIELANRIEHYEDAGHGCALLLNEKAARIMQNALYYNDTKQYELLEWCIMPNHVHVLISHNEDVKLSTIIKSWKSYSAHNINRALGRKGQLWMQDYFDRFVRDDEHLFATTKYIVENPVRAGLVESASKWRWSSGFMNQE